MMIPNWVIGVFFLVHGWSHVWYIIFSHRLIEIKEDMAWTGESWLLSLFLDESMLRLVATVGYAVSMVGFMAGGAGLLLGQAWWRSIVFGSAVVSLITVFLFWDGDFSKIADKGVIGFLIDVAVLVYLTWLG